MNEHEIQRIAAAMHQARPDWPIKQLQTLLTSDTLRDRARRDVFVALAWVASEPNSSSPYRVLEAGPWWKAVGVEGSSSGGRREWPDDAHRCSVCSLHQDRCRSLWAGDHDFTPATQRPDFDVPRTIAELKAAIEPMREPAHTKTVEDLPLEERDPRVVAARAGLTTPTTPPAPTEEHT